MVSSVEVNERIRVLAAFAGGEVSPVRFKWQQRTYAIASVNGHWVDRQDDADLHYFSVQVDSATYFLHFSTRDLHWWLDELLAAEKDQ